MIVQFVRKEMLEMLFGPKFLITFLISLVLVLSSVYSGFGQYSSECGWFVKAKASNVERMENLGSYGNLKDEGTKALRPPGKLGIFVKGVEGTIGRAALITGSADLSLGDSRNSLNPIFSVFGDLDLAFTVKFILSLFALLFSYNAISGECERGTLQQVFSNRVGRASFIIGKSVGGLLTLLITLLVPLLLALLMLMFNLSFTGEEWVRICLMTLGFHIYLAIFYMLGMLMSAVTRSSPVSFLLCLFIWVLAVVVLPKAAVSMAEQVSPAPSIEHVEARRAALRRVFYGDLEGRLERAVLDAYNRNLSYEERDAARDQAYAESHELIAEEERKVLDDYRRRQVRLLRTAETYARVSPASCLTFALNRICTTDTDLRERFSSALMRYRDRFIVFVDRLRSENPDLADGGVSTRVHREEDENGNQLTSVQVEAPTSIIDVSGMPDFHMPAVSLGDTVGSVIPDLAIMFIEMLLFFTAAVAAFLRYDVRP